jgi:hypothetical protein
MELFIHDEITSELDFSSYIVMGTSIHLSSRLILFSFFLLCVQYHPLFDVISFDITSSLSLLFSLQGHA